MDRLMPNSRGGRRIARFVLMAIFTFYAIVMLAMLAGCSTEAQAAAAPTAPDDSVTIRISRQDAEECDRQGGCMLITKAMLMKIQAAPCLRPSAL